MYNELKDLFWWDIDKVIQEVPENEKIIIGDDLNSYVGKRQGSETAPCETIIDYFY